MKVDQKIKGQNQRPERQTGVISIDKRQKKVVGLRTYSEKGV